MGVLCEPTPARPTPARPKPKVDGRRGPKRPEPVESPAYAYPFPPRMIDQAFMKKEQAVRGELLGALAELCPPQHPLFLQH